MAMQYDVQSAHINVTGQMVSGRARVKSIIVTGGGSAGYAYLWDTTSAPVAVTYARSGNTITVTSTAHGLQTGARVGLVLAAGTGGQGTTGNYTITRTGADTYTVQDLNSGSITAGASGLQAPAWLTSIDIGANETVSLPISGEGVLAESGIYASVTNLAGLTVFYG